jgi:lysophospholipase L1-like esterase
VEIGVSSEYTLEGIPPRTTRPLVAYGTSILHGAYASRPGLVYPSRLGRLLDLPVINLGVSGAARMEPEVADLLLELDPAVYLLDPFPNMGLDLVNERLERFLRKLSEGKPEVPIVVVEDFPRTNAWIMPAKQEVDVKCVRIREIIRALQQQGLNLFFVEGRDLLGTDHEASIDGIHPNDVGYHRITENVYPVLRQAIKSRTKESPI